jgi:hypothetical protein
MSTEATLCSVCGGPIPAGRLKAIPETRVCVKCSQDIGGEFELEISIQSTGKPGSLKKTGQDVQARLVPKRLKKR